MDPAGRQRPEPSNADRAQCRGESGRGRKNCNAGRRSRLGGRNRRTMAAISEIQQRRTNHQVHGRIARSSKSDPQPDRCCCYGAERLDHPRCRRRGVAVVDFLEGERLTVVFKYGSLRPRLALEHIEAILASHGVPRVGFKLGGDPPVSLAQALARLEATHSKHFTLVGQGFQFDLSSLARWKLDFLGLRSVCKPGRIWDEWAAPFLKLPDFVMAWVADCEYEYWQNASDPLEY